MRVNERWMECGMERKFSGTFSLGFQSVQLQLRALLEGVGGEQAVRFLDGLSHLGAPAQETILRLCNQLIERVANDKECLANAGNTALKDFEDSLYNEIVKGLQRGPNTPKLEVVWGKKTPASGTGPIDLEAARKLKALRDKRQLN